jgi:hypothetical protein
VAVVKARTPIQQVRAVVLVAVQALFQDLQAHLMVALAQLIRVTGAETLLKRPEFLAAGPAAAEQVQFQTMCRKRVKVE